MIEMGAHGNPGVVWTLGWPAAGRTEVTRSQEETPGVSEGRLRAVALACAPARTDLEDVTPGERARQAPAVESVSRERPGQANPRLGEQISGRPRRGNEEGAVTANGVQVSFWGD